MLRKIARLYAPDPLPGGGGAPAPAPASAPAPAPAPAAPAAAPEPEPEPENPFAEIDAAAARVEPPAPAPAPDPAKGTPPPAIGAAAPPAPKPAPAPGPKELRTELDRVKGELATAAATKTDLERQIAEARKAGESTKALTDQLEAEKSERLKLLAELRALKQEASPEFKEKFDKPFHTMADRAKAVIEKAQVNTPEGPRPANWNDFIGIWNMDEFAAAEAAATMFGDRGAGVVMNYYRELHRLDDTRAEALATERKEYQQRTTAEQAEATTRQQRINEAWEQVNRDLGEKIDGYQNPPEDKDLDEARKKGFAAFDAPVDQSKPNWLKSKILKDAHIRHRVAAFGPNQIVITRQKARIAELEAELAKAKPAPPGGGLRRPGGNPATGGSEKSFEQGLREAVTG